jgi:hypothetical protein
VGQTFIDNLMEDADEEELREHGPADDLDQDIQDAHRGCENNKEKAKFQRMIEDHKNCCIYPDCK